MKVLFPEWLPDDAPFLSQGSQVIKGVYPAGKWYRPIRSLTAVSDAMDGVCLGAVSVQATDGAVHVFAGDATKLYRLVSGSWEDVSVSGGYTLAGTERWEFALYGQRVIAVSKTEDVQYYDIGTSTDFADLAGSPPDAAHVAVIGSFLVLGNTANNDDEVIWSGFNDSEEWTEDTNQSDAQRLLGGGPVQAIVGGTVGFVFQERAITRMSYVGPPVIFQFDTIAEGIGCDSPGSVKRIGNLVYFHSHGGFMVLNTVDGSLTPIGNEKTDRWFSENLTNNTQHQITSGADPLGALVYWGFVSLSGVDTPDKVLILNRVNGRFTYDDLDHEVLFSGLTLGLTLEQLGALHTNLENVPASLDSPVWSGGSIQLQAIDTDHMLGAFTGDFVEATLETTEFEGLEARRSFIENVRALCDTASATALVRSRARLADSLVNSSSGTMQANGDIPVMASGRYHRIQITIPAATTWSYAQGVEVNPKDDGLL